MLRLLLSRVAIFTLVVGSAMAQQQDSVMLRGPWGLNTVSGDFTATGGRVVHNWDLGRNVGSLTRRWGYDSASSVGPKFDSIMYPFGLYLPDGNQNMLYVGDTAGGQYGGVFTTNYNSNNIGSYVQIAQYWGLKYPTSYAVQNGLVFFANGQNRMIAWDAFGGKFTYPNLGYRPVGGVPLTYDKASRPIPPYAPGELEVYPLKDTSGSGKIYGDYMWAATIREVAGGTQQMLSYITPRTRIDSGRALLAGIRDFIVADSVDDTPDSCFVKIYRTKANPGPLTQFTYFYYTGDSVTFPGGASTLVDDTPDSSLSATDSCTPILYRGGLNWKFGPKAGQPRILARTFWVDSLKGLARGTKNLRIAKWAWACTFVDTAVSAESDTGSSLLLDSALAFNSDSNYTKYQSVKLCLPQPNSNYKNMGIKIYRAPVYTRVDSTNLKPQLSFGNYMDSIEIYGKGWIPRVILGQNDNWSQHAPSDTSIFGPFRLVGQLKTGDSVFLDTFSVSQWQSGPILRQNRPPSGIQNLTSLDNRVFGSAGSRLYMSLLDSGAFAQMRFININRDDGDEITAIIPTRRAIRVFKNASSYNVYQDENGQWARSEVSNGIGCIAQRSVAHSAAGWYYLSDKGVILENDGLYLERTQATQLVSAPIKNFDLLPMATKRKAVGMCVDNKYLICIGDTTYVWDEKAQGWSTWSMKFNGATLYGVDANIDFIRPDTMYFVQPNGRTLYRYKGSIWDNGSDFACNWQSPTMLLDGSQKTIQKLGMFTVSTDTADIIGGIVIDELSDTVSNKQFSNTITRYKTASATTNNVTGFSVGVNVTSVLYPSGQTIIDGLNAFYIRQGGVGE